MPVFQVGFPPASRKARVVTLDRADTRRAFRAGVNTVADHFATHSDPKGFTVSVVPVNAFTVAVQLFDHAGNLDAFRWVAVVPNPKNRR